MKKGDDRMDLKFINSIVLIEWLEKSDYDRIQKAKKVGKFYGQRININYRNPKARIHKGNEIATSTSCNDFTVLEKLILIANCSLPNSEEFINFMTREGWNQDKCIELNNLIKQLLILKKNNQLENSNIDITLLEEIDNISKKMFGISCPVHLINRLNDIIVTQKEFFDEKSISKTKKY